MIITDEQLSDFQRDGAVLLRAAFRDWVAPIRRGLERNIEAPSEFARIYQPGDPGGRFFGDYCNWDRISEYRDFLFNSGAAGFAASLMGSDTARIFHEHVLVKEPGNSTVTPWHHDQPYYPVDGAKTCSLWMPLDPVPRDVAIEFVAGSHLWGRSFLPDRFNGDPLYDSRNDFDPVPDIDAARGDYRILGWEMEPGDAVAFHFLTVHGAPANTSSNRRRAFSSRWTGDDCTWAERPGQTSPPFPGVTLKHGDPLDAPEFPVVFQSASTAAGKEARHEQSDLAG